MCVSGLSPPHINQATSNQPAIPPHMSPPCTTLAKTSSLHSTPAWPASMKAGPGQYVNRRRTPQLRRCRYRWCQQGAWQCHRCGGGRSSPCRPPCPQRPWYAPETCAPACMAGGCHASAGYMVGVGVQGCESGEAGKGKGWLGELLEEKASSPWAPFAQPMHAHQAARH